MSLESRVTSKIEVIGEMEFKLKPGGVYYLHENNPTETAVVKLHILQHFIDLMLESYCDCSENVVVYGQEVDALAERVFNTYKPFFEAGLNITDYTEYWRRSTLNKYLQRPMVGGQFNATKEESTEGLPEGWWWDFPGQARKHFIFGTIVVSIDDGIYICRYDLKDTELNNPTDHVDIKQDADYGQIFAKWPGAAIEIAQAAKFAWSYYQDIEIPDVNPAGERY